MSFVLVVVVFRFLNEKQINMEPTFEALSLFLVPSVKTESTSDGTVSRLYLANAGASDSGNYTCSVGSLASTNIAVYVLTGENPSLSHMPGYFWDFRFRKQKKKKHFHLCEQVTFSNFQPLE
jgi:hypothetical protein